jgi:hypothetical protein
MSTRVAARLVAALAMLAALPGCGASGHTDPLAGVPRNLVLEARPIGRGPSFHPPATGPVIGPCRSRLGTRVGVHVELFAANRVVLVAEGIGTRAPRGFDAGRISNAGCYGQLVTIDPTGLVLVRPGTTPTLAQLFRSWGQPLTSSQLASFAAAPGTHVSVFVDGHRKLGPPGQVPLVRHAEIVLEVGPHVPPHGSYTFPLGT